MIAEHFVKTRTGKFKTIKFRSTSNKLCTKISTKRPFVEYTTSLRMDLLDKNYFNFEKFQIN